MRRILTVVLDTWADNFVNFMLFTVFNFKWTSALSISITRPSKHLINVSPLCFFQPAKKPLRLKGQLDNFSSEWSQWPLQGLSVWLPLNCNKFWLRLAWLLFSSVPFLLTKWIMLSEGHERKSGHKSWVKACHSRSHYFQFTLHVIC